jgi:hypothetical protein
MIILNQRFDPSNPTPCLTGGGRCVGQEISLYRAAKKWASSDQNEPESSEAVIIGARHRDRNEPRSSDTMTRGTTADQNEIKCSPLQLKVATVLNLSTSIQDVVSEVVLFSQG